MSIVNFAIPQKLDRRVKDVIKRRGFQSRAELFRFAVLHYLDETDRGPLSHNLRITALSDELAAALESRTGARRLPSVRQQILRMNDLS